MHIARTGLLTGIRVVDLTGAYGGFGPRLLADLGAEVVRIETAAPAEPLGHLHRNVGKVVVRLDPGDPGTPDTVHSLLAGADIALCGDAPVAGFGAPSAADLLARHPHLVVTAVTPFGIEGAVADRRATELVAQCLAGVVYRSGVPELPPVSAPGAYCEDVGAAVAAMASLIALWQGRGGRPGQVVDTSTILALAQCTEMALPLWSALKADQVRNGAGLYPLFECRDGLARLVLPMAPAEWRNLIEWLGSPPEWTGPEWERAMLAPAEREQILARLPAVFAAGTRQELADSGDAAGVRITPVLTPAEVLGSEHAAARGTFGPVDVGDREARVVASPFVVDGARSSAVRAPVVGGTPSWAPRPAPARTSAEPALPLAGLRVLEIGNGIAAPEAGRVLGEWGADVIKVESARRPDFQRKVLGGDMSPAFATPARGKRSLAVDLGTDEGRQLVLDLLPSVDIVIENYAVGVLDRLGLGWDALSAANPGVVLVGTQLYGDQGPWASKKGYGPSARAVGGVTWLWAHGPDAPRGVMTIYPDHLAGRLVTMAALAGLLQRERTGRGCRVNLAQSEVVSLLIGELLLAESLTPGAAQPAGNRSPHHAPWDLYRCADDDTGAERWIAVCVPDDAAWVSLLSVDPERAASLRLDRAAWRTEAGRLADRDAVEAAVAEWVRPLDATALEEQLQAAGVPGGQALFPRLQVDHPLFVERGYTVPLDQPGYGPLLMEGPAFTGTGMVTPRCDPAPLPGQHTADICRDLLGLDSDRIAALVAAGALDPLPG